MGERHVRMVVVDWSKLTHGNKDFIDGKFVGIMEVGCNLIDHEDDCDVLITPTDAGRITLYECFATDAEWANTRRYLLESELYRSIITQII